MSNPLMSIWCIIKYWSNRMFCPRFNESVEGLDQYIYIHLCTSCTKRNNINRVLPNNRIKTHCMPNANGFSWSSTHLKSKNKSLVCPHSKNTQFTVTIETSIHISLYELLKQAKLKTFLTHSFFFKALIIIKRQKWKFITWFPLVILGHLTRVLKWLNILWTRTILPP